MHGDARLERGAQLLVGRRRLKRWITGVAGQGAEVRTSAWRLLRRCTRSPGSRGANRSPSVAPSTHLVRHLGVDLVPKLCLDAGLPERRGQAHARRLLPVADGGHQHLGLRLANRAARLLALDGPGVEGRRGKLSGKQAACGGRCVCKRLKQLAYGACRHQRARQHRACSACARSCASMMANTRSMPIDTPTAGTSLPLNMPTSVS